ncbi:THUMP-like domain-containing protein [Spirilliplanes yamanashiensis]|uniref:Methyltransferase n=1 Tax=Spirilliplanes yamanashiensis TaxID=42233 RepID=A0A8J3YAC9_9ACTN|nr:methyltransferase domain-containing protein [Spirilliplanes yamanashiensis]MDP9815946.1 SAM-dependent methyltransferase [Spirilliplanes yamanashiensis]GIJ04202.1 methyltransferase [Spirilliplanes yamanashiensis]
MLRTPSGDAALAAAALLGGDDPLAAAAALRKQGFAPELAAAALTQVALRRKAAGKFGPDAARMFFTRAGLEQATRRVVADRRAARLAAAGVTSLADLGCGLGADALAAARAGIAVHAVDADPGTAALAAANAEALGLAGLVTVSCADATTVDVGGHDAVFCDPARRVAGGRRVFDPAAFSPPWDFVAGLAGRVPRTVLKLAPGIGHELLPPGAEGEWVSVDGDLVEAAFWCGPLAAAPRRATVLRGGAAAELTGSGTAAADAGPVGAYVWDPDPAVVRSHLVAEFAAAVGGRLADPTIAYVHADTHVPSPFGRCIAVTDVLPFSLKRLRALLRERGVGRAEILKRGSALDPAALRRDLRLAGPHGVSLVLTRVGGAPTVLVGHPVGP